MRKTLTFLAIAILILGWRISYFSPLSWPFISKRTGSDAHYNVHQDRSEVDLPLEKSSNLCTGKNPEEEPFTTVSSNPYYSGKILEASLIRLFSAELGHTLVGAKPISEEGFLWLKYFPNEAQEVLIAYLKRVFAKSSEYIIRISTPLPKFPKYTSITLVHIPALRKTIAESCYLSAFVKKKYGNVEGLLRRLKHLDERFCFSCDDVALGIAYGYGEENVRYAERVGDLAFFLKKYPLVCLFSFEPMPDPRTIIRALTRSFPPLIFDTPIPKKDPRFESFEDEWLWLKRHEFQIPRFGPPYLFQLPSFTATDCKETQRILRKSFAARNKVSKLYCEKTFTRGVEEWVQNHHSTARE
jgi:hypothetical protein